MSAKHNASQNDRAEARGITWGRYTERDIARLFARPIIKVDIATGAVMALGRKKKEQDYSCPKTFDLT